MFAHQSNTQKGLLRFLAGEDLSAITTPRLATIQNNADTGALAGEIVLPSAVTKHCPYLLLEGAADAKLVTVAPLDTDRNFRCEAKGTGNAGALLTMADPTTAADKGKVRDVSGAGTGTFIIVGIAEEDFVDGQWVLFRPYRHSVTQ